MIWKSVVGKLWLTILLLVSVVLLFLTILLLQFFENFHIKEVENQMTHIGSKVSALIESQQKSRQVYMTASEIVDAYSARAVIINQGSYWVSPKKDNLPALKESFFKNDMILRQALLGKDTVVKQGDFVIHNNKQTRHERMMVIGVPIRLTNGKYGAVYIFQSLNVIQQSTNAAKKLIYISAFIAFILTTFFAFFLSTRIAAPLRSMRIAALALAKGEFDTRVPVLTRDEIGELGLTFNRMAQQLKFNLAALNQEKEQLSGILNSMADGVMTFDKNGKILITNPPAVRFINAWKFDENDVNTDKKVPEEIQDLFHATVANEEKDIIEVTYHGRTWVILMTPLYDGDEVRGAVAVFRDMTEERRLDEMRQGFIANVSHELRTPIALLQGYSEAIVDGIAATEEDKRDIAKIIYDESLRMGRLVNELLDLARLEAGHFQMNKTKVKLETFFERVVFKFTALAKEAGVQLSYQGLIDKERTGCFDPDRVEQVVTNLVDNAIRHTKENGLVTLRVELIEKGILLSVEDTGSGISKEDLPFVFERFYKADKARTRGKAGTGLGLAIAKNIVEAHGGKISVTSKLGHGTTFECYLPDQN